MSNVLLNLSMHTLMLIKDHSYLMQPTISRLSKTNLLVKIFSLEVEMFVLISLLSTIKFFFFFFNFESLNFFLLLSNLKDKKKKKKWDIIFVY